MVKSLRFSTQRTCTSWHRDTARPAGDPAWSGFPAGPFFKESVMAEKKSWRDVYKVHPAADLFPMLPEDELRKLGEDIKANGLRENIVLWSPGRQEDNQAQYLLDGRNRLAALDLVG